MVLAFLSPLARIDVQTLSIRQVARFPMLPASDRRPFFGNLKNRYIRRAVVSLWLNEPAKHFRVALREGYSFAQLAPRYSQLAPPPQNKRKLTPFCSAAGCLEPRKPERTKRHPLQNNRLLHGKRVSTNRTRNQNMPAGLLPSAVHRWEHLVNHRNGGGAYQHDKQGRKDE